MKPFDRNLIRLEPLGSRRHNLDLSNILPVVASASVPTPLVEVAKAIHAARVTSSPVILMMGGHVIRSGVQRYLIDLMERGLVTCISMNGAGVIHDFEFALIGATTESVARYVSVGQFGFWKETGQINEIVSRAYKRGCGMGEAVGEEILKGKFPHKDISVLAQAFRLGVPVTVHVGIGYDIVHEHPNFDPAAAGAASYRDFLVLAEILRDLENGVVMNFGSAVMGPEVFLKALSMARNVAAQEGRSIGHFTTLVCDLHPLPDSFSSEAPPETPGYYFRPWKTMLVRTVADGGKSWYVQGRHAVTIPALWTALQADEARPGGG